MATLYSPQSQAGIMSFYDAPSKGPAVPPKLMLGAIIAFAVVVLLADKLSML